MIKQSNQKSLHYKSCSKLAMQYVTMQMQYILPVVHWSSVYFPKLLNPAYNIKKFLHFIFKVSIIRFY